MAGSDQSAARVIEDLLNAQSDAELPLIRKRLAPGEEAFGMRMRHLFDVAKTYTDIELDDVELLLDHPAYESRMAAICILDFKARRPIGDHERRQLADIYLSRHDRITTWDMVDRAAPRVLGGHLIGRAPTPLHDLAISAEPLRRRSAITAPLYFVRAGSDVDVTVGFDIAAGLVEDPEPVVTNAVGIFLKHAAIRDPDAVHRFLGAHSSAMPRAALRLAIDRFEPGEKARYQR
jgi:3-methyladenine DNA glycosylase AlkD